MKNTVTIIRKNSRPEVQYMQLLMLASTVSHTVAVRKISIK